MNSTDKSILRELAKKYMEICNDDMQDKFRELWRMHNSLCSTEIPVYVRTFAWQEMNAT